MRTVRAALGETLRADDNGSKRKVEYQLSPDYLRMRANGPRRVALMVAVVSVILALCTFLPRSAPPITETLPTLAIVFVFLITIAILQTRGMRKANQVLASLSYGVQSDGITCNVQDGPRFVRFSSMKKVTVLRHFWRKQIVQVLVHIDHGVLPVSGLDQFEEFVREMRMHAPSLPVKDKYTWVG